MNWKTSVNSPQPLAANNSRLVGRTALLLVLLSVEILAFSFRYDVQPLKQSDAFLGQAAGHATSIFCMLVVAAVVVVVSRRRVAPVCSGY